MKKTITTGQVAQLCGVSPRTVAGWMDSGLLSAYRIPEGRGRNVRGKERRTTLECLLGFLDTNHMPQAETVRQSLRHYKLAVGTTGDALPWLPEDCDRLPSLFDLAWTLRGGQGPAHILFDLAGVAYSQVMHTARMLNRECPCRCRCAALVYAGADFDVRELPKVGISTVIRWPEERERITAFFSVPHTGNNTLQLESYYNGRKKEAT